MAPCTASPHGPGATLTWLRVPPAVHQHMSGTPCLPHQLSTGKTLLEDQSGSMTAVHKMHTDTCVRCCHVAGNYGRAEVQQTVNMDTLEMDNNLR